MNKKILVIDVGGTHVKIFATGQKTAQEVVSGPKMTARMMCDWVKQAASNWPHDVASIGYPGPVVHGKPFREPHNLGKGWVGFDYKKALGCPIKIINDAAMQALGSYEGGRMLFLGLGTGLGSAMIVDGVVEPMELAHLPYKHGKTYEDYLGIRGLERLGKKEMAPLRNSHCGRAPGRDGNGLRHTRRWKRQEDHKAAPENPAGRE